LQYAKLITLLVALLGAAGLAGCASPSLTEGRELLGNGATEAGLARLHAGLTEEPDNVELRSYYYSQREKLASQRLTQAQQEINQANFVAAEATLKGVISIDPENPRAKTMLANLEREVDNHRLLAEAQTALNQKDPVLAEAKAQQVLTHSPGHAGAIDMERRIQAALAQEENAPRKLGFSSHKTVTLEFRDTPLRNVFDMISRQSSINFVFDKDVRLDTKATLFARNTTVADAINMLLTTGQLDKKVMGPTTLLIYPDTPQKQKQYQELMVKSFYLGNADAKSVMAMLRVLIKSKDMYVDERLNQLIIRDTPDAIRLAEKIIATQDIAEPEVMLHVEVLEVKRSLLLNLGVQYPNQFSLINPNPLTTQLTLESLKTITASTTAISPTPAVNIKQDNSDVNILANPRIRVKNREKAKILIGDKLPVITTTSTANVGISDSVSYLDVGLKLEVEPNVQMHDDVQIKVNLEVSNIVKEVRSTNGTLTYQIGTRNANTVLRLKDGETQVLAGLISEEERGSSSGIPGLSSLPVLGHLFSNKNNEHIKTEIVLLITPYILRNAQAQQPAVTEFRGGTENSIGGGGGVIAPALPNVTPNLPRGQFTPPAPDTPVAPPPNQDIEPEPLPVPELPPLQPDQGVN
jgi:general secretion pathway protein D